MFTTIVVGTDGSDSASIALQRAAELARAGGGTLHIVHAYQPMSLGAVAAGASNMGPSVDVQQINVGISDHAAVVCNQAADAVEGDGLTFETHSVPGDPTDALISVAESVEADLVVVGNRGMTSMKRFVLGNVPNKISHHAPCSVLIVRTT